MIKKNNSNTKDFLLIDLLQTFEKKEIERFRQFISSDYFNSDPHVILLLDALRKYVLNKKPFDPTLQTKAYQVIFPKNTIVNNLLSKVQKKGLWIKMTLLIKLAKRFLIIEAIEDTPDSESKLLNKKLLEKKQFNLCNRTAAKSKKQLENQIKKDINHYAFAFEIELGKMNYFYQAGTLIKEDNFPELIYNLDMFYLVTKLRFYSTMYSILGATTQKDYDFTPLEAIDSLLILPQYEKDPLIILYNTIIQLMKTNKEELYFHLLALLEKSTPLLSKNNLIDFYSVACNFCANKIMAGHLNYKKEVLALYKIMDSKKILIEKDFIDIVKLKNIVSQSCHLGDFAWATEIISKYYPFVKKEYQNSVYHFNLGLIDFYQSKYKAAISHFIRVEKINLAYDVDCKMLLLKAYYQMDTQYDERTMQIFRSTEKFIHTNKSMPFSHKRSYKNFIQILINLYRVRHQVGKVTLEGVQKKMGKMEFVSDKKWLLEKIEDISKQSKNSRR